MNFNDGWGLLLRRRAAARPGKHRQSLRCISFIWHENILTKHWLHVFNTRSYSHNLITKLFCGSPQLCILFKLKLTSKSIRTPSVNVSVFRKVSIRNQFMSSQRQLCRNVCIRRYVCIMQGFWKHERLHVTRAFTADVSTAPHVEIICVPDPAFLQKAVVLTYNWNDYL